MPTQANGGYHQTGLAQAAVFHLRVVVENGPRIRRALGGRVEAARKASHQSGAIRDKPTACDSHIQPPPVYRELEQKTRAGFNYFEFID
jgi:hypothetical protein